MLFDSVQFYHIFSHHVGNYSESAFAPQMSQKDTSLDNQEVDVEQWSDSEDQKQNRNSSPLSLSKTNVEDDQNSAAPKKRKKEEKPKFLKPNCNSEELLGIDCFLETTELWNKFNELGTEMIITKTGR